MRESGIARHVGAIGLSTAISRILGYTRDVLIASQFGTGLVADAFFVAYRIPNLLRRLLGEGALSASFIPVFTEQLETRGPAEARALLQSLFIRFLALLAGLVVLGMVLTPWLVAVIAPGFTGNPEKMALTIQLTRVLFPFLVAIGLAALALGVLNSLRQFIVPALAPCMLSLWEILFLLAICPILSRPIFGLAMGALLGGFAQFAFHLPALRRAGFAPRLAWTAMHPAVKRVGLLMGPALIGLSVDQVNAFVDTMCASWLREGSVAALYYSNRVMQLPLALFGISAATVALPIMSSASARGDLTALRETFSSSVRLALFLTLPATAGLMVLARPIIQLLFERGEFTSAATTATGFALFWFSAGIAAFSAGKVAAGAFYAMQDTKTPVRVAMLAMLVNVVLNLMVVFVPVLRDTLGVGGLALATSISGFLNLGVLVVLLRRRLGYLGGRRLLNACVRIAGAALGMAVLVAALARVLPPWPVVIRVPCLILAGVGGYAALSVLLDVRERHSVKDLLLRRGVADPE